MGQAKLIYPLVRLIINYWATRCELCMKNDHLQIYNSFPEVVQESLLIKIEASIERLEVRVMHYLQLVRVMHYLNVSHKLFLS